MRLSIPLRCRNPVEISSHSINAFGFLCVLGAIIWGGVLRSHFPSTPLSDADTLDVRRYRVTYSHFYLLMRAKMATFLIVVAPGLLSLGFAGRPDQNSNEREFPSSKSARV
jgi:hypothetical protein